ncbi:L-serine ammonia-lyase [candidate division WOR-1 bacterium RIFCSPHIGHO2_01_FULL_53_15]|uniref:L-serine dehydratase n=1 Tax=candidate division WOR-1 bacterium RIFCSPHIGHO2_01_FULL_53_15 TaxID=1802564 RepID=A0A1F4PYQ0_UNCSA|nr:MAG: L-serine ammonia-lyase [candidate division WOR-1 bacterium RIFCSPHIGHO2_01_FULL_53_15]OGC10675.1 MAG: L-serine ammonia-lyase [candidate division WOR-1 bacterium RIFCSPHIGHO2_02_FULL_53_26]
MNIIRTSVFNLFKIGPGPSSSHTIGPMKAAFHFRQALAALPAHQLKRSRIEVTLFGSLSATGRGHGTDRAILAGLLGWQPETVDTEEFAGLLAGKDASYQIRINDAIIPFSSASINFAGQPPSSVHPNTMVIRLVGRRNRITLEKEYYSIGGGLIKIKGEPEKELPQPVSCYGDMKDLRGIIENHGIDLPEVIMRNEMEYARQNRWAIEARLKKILEAMEASVERGLKTEGILPGSIGLARKAPTLFRNSQVEGREFDRLNILLSAYAMAAAEENAAGHIVVTAPTFGACGVIPGLMYFLKHDQKLPQQLLRDGLLAAAAVGFIIKHNASISGAEVGCQGEIGSAAAMAAAFAAQAHGKPISIVENAAEIALEHFLGLPCDPIGGLVQIPCIERNAVAANHAYVAYLLASLGDPQKQKIGLDQVVATMKRIGEEMTVNLKETAGGGLALINLTNC